MSDEAEPGSGNIAIQLDGEDLELVPTAGACLAISRLGGGLNAAVQRCINLDMDTMCAIIVAGLGWNPRMGARVPEMVFKTGLIQLSAPCIDFINVVGNGGRPLPPEGEEEQPDPLKPASP